MEYKIIIAGDIFPTPSNMDLFVEGKGDLLFGNDITTLFRNSDFRIVNCEGAFYKENSPIQKSGPIIGAMPDSINGLMYLKPSLVSLANNHSLDYGVTGYHVTTDLMKRNKVEYIGIGDNLTDASRPYIFETPIGKIGVYACAEYEFTIATETKCGANPYDPLVSFDIVEQLKKEVDYVIVMYHGGKEYYQYPTPMVQRVCRKFVDKGADFVLTNHSHCIGCAERYKNAQILYGQGDFLFARSEHILRKTGLLVEISLEKKEEISATIKYIPVQKQENTVRLATSNEIIDEFVARGERIKEKGFIEAQYADFSQQYVKNYIMILCGRSKIIRLLIRVFYRSKSLQLVKTYFKKWQVLALINVFRCQAHYEIMSNILINAAKEELNDNR